MKLEPKFLTSLIFSLAGAAGAITAGLITYFSNGFAWVSYGPSFDILSWGLWPMKIFGMGLGELSNTFWIVLVALNAIVFGTFGLLLGFASVSKPRLLPAYFSLISILFLWCAWLTGFAINGGTGISILCVIAFYSIPFIIVAYYYRAHSHP